MKQIDKLCIYLYQRNTLSKYEYTKYMTGLIYTNVEFVSRIYMHLMATNYTRENILETDK